MSIRTPRIPEALEKHLRTSSNEHTNSLSRYVEDGGKLITADAVAALRDLLPVLREKIKMVETSGRLRQRLELFARYFEETLGDAHVSQEARRDVSFALFYFLKGYDRIPDSVPEIGLLDDALVVEAALQKHLSALRDHWLRHGRTWPDAV